MSSQSFMQRIQPIATFIRGGSFWRDLHHCFRSVHLAIVLLSLLAIGTIIGVVMPQEGMVDLADIRQKYGPNFEFLRAAGFFNVYSSFWFITLQVLFFFNLLVGSFKWLKPATLAAVQKTTLPAHVIVHKPEAHSLSQCSTLPKDQLAVQLTRTLAQFRYGVYRDGSGNLYASKGNITRLGPCIAHLGILLCLVAGVYSSFTGFKGVKMAVPGQTFAIQEADTLKTNTPPPLWQGKIPDWKIRVHDFQVHYYKIRPDIAEQYYSKLSIVSPEGQILKQETISVNHPLVYDDISIYQASFAPTGRFHLTVNGEPLVVSINNQFNQRPISVSPLKDGSILMMFPFFAQQDPGVTENFGVFFIRRPGEPVPQGQMPENIRLAEGQSGKLKGYTLAYNKPEMSTGLQIKRAPEVPLMYLSYIVIAIGTLLCFFSQRQLWVTLREAVPGKTEVILYPKTNKARLSFQKEMFSLLTALSQGVCASKPAMKEQPR